MGADRMVRCRTMPDAAGAVRLLRTEGYAMILAAEPGPESVFAWNMQYEFPLGLVFGNEALGVSPEALAEVDGLVGRRCSGKSVDQCRQRGGGHSLCGRRHGPIRSEIMKIRLVGKNLEDIRPLLALADFAEAGEGETPELVVTHGGDGALLGAARDYPQLPILPVRDARTAPLCPRHECRHPARSVRAGGPGCCRCR